MNINELENQLQNVKHSIDRALKESGYKDNLDLAEIEMDIQNPQERFLLHELEGILGNLNKAVEELDYIAKPIETIGLLHKAENGRYRARDGKGNEWEYSSGTGIEFLIKEEELDAYGGEIQVERWVASRVEHNGNDYYIVNWPDLNMKGLAVRKRSYWS